LGGVTLGFGLVLGFTLALAFDEGDDEDGEDEEEGAEAEDVNGLGAANGDLLVGVGLTLYALEAFGPGVFLGAVLPTSLASGVGFQSGSSVAIRVVRTPE
jgi:hypothetical protein